MIAMRKVSVIITARPSYSRIKSALKSLQSHPYIDLSIILSSSSLLERYGNAQSIIESDGYDIYEKIYSHIDGDSLSLLPANTGLSLIHLSNTLNKLKPDIVVTIADRYETIANAIAASYMNIPLVHIQGGEFTGSIDNKVRFAITKLADCHFVSSDFAKKRVLNMGESPEFVINTGCPSIDLAVDVQHNPDFDFDLFQKYTGTGPRFSLDNGYLVVMQHPVTTEFEESSFQIQCTIDALNNFNMPVIWFWPNVDTGSDSVSKVLRVFREKNPDLPYHFFKNLEPVDFLRLIKNSSCLIGNSSVGIRESAYLGVPVVNIGSRQNGRERASNVIDVDYNPTEISSAVKKQLLACSFPSSNIYGDGNSGERIANLLATLNITIEKPDLLLS